MKYLPLLLLLLVPVMAGPVNTSTVAAKTFYRRTGSWGYTVTTPPPLTMQRTNTTPAFWSPEAKAARGRAAALEYDRTNNVPIQ